MKDLSSRLSCCLDWNLYFGHRSWIPDNELGLHSKQGLDSHDSPYIYSRGPATTLRSLWIICDPPKMPLYITWTSATILFCGTSQRQSGFRYTPPSHCTSMCLMCRTIEDLTVSNDENGCIPLHPTCVCRWEERSSFELNGLGLDNVRSNNSKSPLSQSMLNPFYSFLHITSTNEVTVCGVGSHSLRHIQYEDSAGRDPRIFDSPLSTMYYKERGCNWYIKCSIQTMEVLTVHSPRGMVPR